jgi:hypothetical protein
LKPSNFLDEKPEEAGRARSVLRIALAPYLPFIVEVNGVEALDQCKVEAKSRTEWPLREYPTEGQSDCLQMGLLPKVALRI